MFGNGIRTLIAGNAYIGLNLVEVDLIGRVVENRGDHLNNHSCQDAVSYNLNFICLLCFLGLGTYSYFLAL